MKQGNHFSPTPLSHFELGPELAELGYLVSCTQAQKTPYHFFSYLCNFVVPFIKKSTMIKDIREEWTNERNAHARKTNTLQKKTNDAIAEAIEILLKRLSKSDIEKRKELLQQLERGQKILRTGGDCLGPDYFETAYEHLRTVCQELIDLRLVEMLEGIATTSDRNDANSPNPPPPIIESIHCGCHLIELSNQRKVMNWDRLDEAWAIWEHLCLAEYTWYLPTSFWESKQLEMGSVAAVQRSNHLFNINGYWHEMQCIRQQRHTNHAPIFFINERFAQYLQYICCSIVYWRGITKSASPSRLNGRFYSLVLRLHEQTLLLDAEEQENGARATYLLHNCREGEPLTFIKELIEKVGHRVYVPDRQEGGQSAAKLLSALGLKGPLRNVFFSKGATKSTVLQCQKAVLKEIKGVDMDELHQQILMLELIEGSHTLRNYKEMT